MGRKITVWIFQVTARETKSLLKAAQKKTPEGPTV